MLKTKAFLLAAALTGLGAASAYAQTAQYVGTTTATFYGDAGYFAPHEACAADFPGSVWCTSQMIIEGGPAPLAVFDENSAWVNPTPTGTTSNFSPTTGAVIDLWVTDFSGRTSSQPSSHLNCLGWNSLYVPGTGPGTPYPGVAASGMVLQQGTNGPTFSNLVCDQPRPAACCAVTVEVKVKGR